MLLRPLGELRLAEDLEIHPPAQSTLGGLEALQQVARPQLVAYDHHIDIAAGDGPVTGNGAVYECPFDLARERAQRFPNRIRDSEGLEDDALQLLEYGGIGVRTVKGLASLTAPQDQAQAQQVLELALNLTGTDPGTGDDLAKVHRPLGIGKEGAKDIAASLAEKAGTQVLGLP